MVEQFGLATMPFGMLRSASALTSGTTSGTSGSMRQALELSITTAPARGGVGIEAVGVVEHSGQGAKDGGTSPGASAVACGGAAGDRARLREARDWRGGGGPTDAAAAP